MDAPTFSCGWCKADGKAAEGPLLWSRQLDQNPQVLSTGRILVHGACQAGHANARIVAVQTYEDLATVPNMATALAFGAAIKYGFDKGRAKVTEDRDRAMHQLSLAGLTRKQIGRAYGLGEWTVNQGVARGRRAAEADEAAALAAATPEEREEAEAAALTADMIARIDQYQQKEAAKQQRLAKRRDRRRKTNAGS